MEDHIPIPVYVNDFWAIFNLVRGMAYSSQRSSGTSATTLSTAVGMSVSSTWTALWDIARFAALLPAMSQWVKANFASPSTLSDVENKSKHTQKWLFGHDSWHKLVKTKKSVHVLVKTKKSGHKLVKTKKSVHVSTCSFWYFCKREGAKKRSWKFVFKIRQNSGCIP